MRYSIVSRGAHRDERTAYPQERRPVRDSQRQVGVLGGPLGGDAMGMYQKEVTGSSSNQEDRGVASRCAYRAQQPGQGLEDRPVR